MSETPKNTVLALAQSILEFASGFEVDPSGEPTPISAIRRTWTVLRRTPHGVGQRLRRVTENEIEEALALAASMAKMRGREVF